MQSLNDLPFTIKYTTDGGDTPEIKPCDGSESSTDDTSMEMSDDERNDFIITFCGSVVPPSNNNLRRVIRDLSERVVYLQGVSSDHNVNITRLESELSIANHDLDSSNAALQSSQRHAADLAERVNEASGLCEVLKERIAFLEQQGILFRGACEEAEEQYATAKGLIGQLERQVSSEKDTTQQCTTVIQYLADTAERLRKGSASQALPLVMDMLKVLEWDLSVASAKVSGEVERLSRYGVGPLVVHAEDVDLSAVLVRLRRDVRDLMLFVARIQMASSMSTGDTQDESPMAMYLRQLCSGAVILPLVQILDSTKSVVFRESL
ncbi:hypothetical protein V5O48_015995 [Marasmius crinis-equi]|uniref:Uncharacterized protein n=1 Tax=Marasmius crinis-equi TaxID=585013 RepID=A0ABR3ET10_9AGAR